MNDLAGKVAFVTGAASGIGLGIARAAVEAGMSVMLADIEAPALERAVDLLRDRGGDAAACEVDVSDAASVMSAADTHLKRFGRIHLLCNNAGVSTGGLVDTCDDGDWAWTIAVNFQGVLNGCRAFLPHIKRQGEGGHVVNTASMAGLLGGVAGWGPYNSTKFAVVGLTEVLRQEGRDSGFGASVLCPGAVNTNIYEAPRNRPQRFGPQVSRVAVMESPDELQSGLDPDVVGSLVLEAVRANRLYIFTDPRYVKMVEKRHTRLLEDFRWAAESETLTAAHAPGARG